MASVYQMGSYESPYAQQIATMLQGYSNPYASQIENLLSTGYQSKYADQIESLLNSGYNTEYKTQLQQALSNGFQSDYSTKLQEALNAGFQSDYSQKLQEALETGFQSDYSQQLKDALAAGYSSKYDSQISELVNNPYQNQYTETVQNLLAELQDSEFSYDAQSDPSYQALLKQARLNSRNAISDTLGKAAAATGGQASSWAVSAAQQAGNNYLAQLDAQIPSLYEAAYNKYANEYAKKLNLATTLSEQDDSGYSRWKDQLTTYSGLDETDYNRWRDTLSDLSGMEETDYNRWRNTLSDLSSQEQTDYSRWRDTLSDLSSQEQTDYSRYQDLLTNLASMNETEFNEWYNTITNLRAQDEADAQSYQDELDRYNTQYQLGLDQWVKENANLTDQEESAYSQWLTSEQQKYTANQQQYQNLVTLIGSTGYSPTDEELALAGMTRSEAQAWQSYYQTQMALSASGGSGGSGGSYSYGDDSSDDGSLEYSEIRNYALSDAKAGNAEDALETIKLAYDSGYLTKAQYSSLKDGVEKLAQQAAEISAVQTAVQTLNIPVSPSTLTSDTYNASNMSTVGTNSDSYKSSSTQNAVASTVLASKVGSTSKLTTPSSSSSSSSSSSNSSSSSKKTYTYKTSMGSYSGTTALSDGQLTTIKSYASALKKGSKTKQEVKNWLNTKSGYSSSVQAVAKKLLGL